MRSFIGCTFSCFVVEELATLGNDFGRILFDAVFANVLARAQVAFDPKAVAFLDVFVDDFGKAPVGDHAMPLRVFAFLAVIKAIAL